MIAADTAQGAHEALWACVVELAEAAHDQAVAAQAHPSSAARDQLADCVRGLGVLLDAVALLDAARASRG
jgi:hypothetical protein